MVRVAVAAGTGSVAYEVVDKILQKKKHQIVVLTERAIPCPIVDHNGVKWVQVDFRDKWGLVDVLRGIDVVLCFFSSVNPINVVKNSKNLIDASIQAGVKRFAPSEWACRNNHGIPHYFFKDYIREYLEETNDGRLRLEYTLFQPGLFTNYFGYPNPSSKHLWLSPCFIDYEKRRAIVVGDGNFPVCLTTVQDLGGVVAEALDYEGRWPVDGGFFGTRTTVAELVRLGEKIRGPMNVERVSLDDLRAGQLKTSWCPTVNHPEIPEEHRKLISRNIMITTMRSMAEGAWNVSSGWNELLPGYQFTSAEYFLRELWAGKP